LIDSLLSEFSNESALAKDSLLHATLTQIEAPHPHYVNTAALHLKSVYAYYIDTLKMRTVGGKGKSRIYAEDGEGLGKFPVDIGDIGTADSRYRGEYYGITYPSPSSILLENDFLYNSELGEDDQVKGLPIRSIVDQVVLRDYSQDWEEGLKVTLAHEFYHAVQFSYTPNISRYHAWYEISATGMEERLAPEVDDYFQYLPCILRNPGRVTLLQENRGPCTHAPFYGNSIFFQYLSATLSPDFDRIVWEELMRNGDKLTPALDSTFSRQGKSFTGLWSDYAFQLASSGLKVKSESAFFSPDLHRWPTLVRDTLSADAYELAGAPLNLPALSFRVGEAPRNSGTEVLGVLAQYVTGADRWLLNGDQVSREKSESNRPPLFPKSTNDRSAWVWSNASPTQSGRLLFLAPENDLYAFPNPLPAQDSLISFSIPLSFAVPALLRILDEKGRLVSEMEVTEPGTVVDWNLKPIFNNQVVAGQKRVAAGIYRFTVGNESALLVLLPYRTLKSAFFRLSLSITSRKTLRSMPKKLAAKVRFPLALDRAA
jgi:hypothetical protein